MNTYRVEGDQLIESEVPAVVAVAHVERQIRQAQLDFMRTAELPPEPCDLEAYIDSVLGSPTVVCSMCGETSHSEREQTDEGEWDEDCIFRPYFDGDGNDLRRSPTTW